MAAAHARHPERFVGGVPQPLAPAAEVWINPPENRPTVRTLELPRDTKFVTVHGAGSSDGDFRPVIWASTASVT